MIYMYKIMKIMCINMQLFEKLYLFINLYTYIITNKLFNSSKLIKFS